MNVVYHSRLVPEFAVSPNKGRRWKLAEPFKFSVDDQPFEAPAGFWTDFASVPRIVWPLVSPYDLGVGPIPHDFGYFTGFATKEYWDMVFLACMEKDHIPTWKRASAYQAVSWFAGLVWRGYRKTNTKFNLRMQYTDSTMAIPNWGLRHHDKSIVSDLLFSPAELEWKQRLGALTGD